MSDKSTAHEAASPDSPYPRDWIARILFWLDWPRNRELVRAASRALHRFAAQQDAIAIALIVFALMFLLFQAGKLIAYAPEIVEWARANWPDLRL